MRFKNCDVVLFIDKISQEAIDNLKNLGVILYDVPRKILGTRAIVQNYRFKIYEDFLTENKDKYNMVFTADIRDTIFQKDIFQFFSYDKPFLGVFYEDDIIKNTKTNSDWVKFYCGEKILDVISNERIICSGTIIGTVDKFIELSHIIWKTVVDKNGFRYFGEQGILNCYIYYYKLFNDCLLTKDNHGPVMTLAVTKKKK